MSFDRFSLLGQLANGTRNDKTVTKHTKLTKSIQIFVKIHAPEIYIYKKTDEYHTRALKQYKISGWISQIMTDSQEVLFQSIVPAA